MTSVPSDEATTAAYGRLSHLVTSPAQVSPALISAYAIDMPPLLDRLRRYEAVVEAIQANREAEDEFRRQMIENQQRISPAALKARETAEQVEAALAALDEESGT